MNCDRLTSFPWATISPVEEKIVHRIFGFFGLFVADVEQKERSGILHKLLDNSIPRGCMADCKVP